MAFRIPRYHHHLLVLITILCLSVLIFFFLQYECYNSKTISNIHKQISQHHHHLHRRRPNLAMSRKVLASKFDFTPFVNRRKQHHQRRPSKDHHTQPADNSDEVDPRYGVEKRRVPTGPNPLHHRWVPSQVIDEVKATGKIIWMLVDHLLKPMVYVFFFFFFH